MGFILYERVDKFFVSINTENTVVTIVKDGNLSFIRIIICAYLKDGRSKDSVE